MYGVWRAVMLLDFLAVKKRPGLVEAISEASVLLCSLHRGEVADV